MLILDGITTVDSDQLFIPLYHRGHMSLKSGTTVTLALIPPRPRPVSPQLWELIISPIDFRSWQSLWRIEATFLERPGIVNKLLRIIATEGLNVLNEESSSVENRDLHMVELVLDTQSAGRTDDIKRMTAIERRILALCIEDLHFERNEPRLRVKRMKGLHNAFEKFQRSRSHAHSVRPVHDTSFISNRRIPLPLSITGPFREETPLRSLLVSDTKERLLRAFFPGADDGFTYVRVAHHDSPGALAAITQELAKAFDIVNSLTRIQRQGSQNHLELLLFSSEFRLPSYEGRRREVIEELLSNSTLNFLNPQVSYPTSVASSQPPGRPPHASGVIVPVKTNRHVARINDKFMHQSTGAVLQSRVEEYERLVERQPSFVKRDPLQQRLKTLREFLNIEGEPSPQPKIFVSYDFSRADLSNIVFRKLKRLRCRCITGANPDEALGAFRDVIMSRIRTCDAFLGIWTKKADESESPWFIWELAVAQAFDLPFRLLIHEGINADKYLKINPERHHRIFKDSAFQQESALTIKRLLDDLAQRARKEERLRFT